MKVFFALVLMLLLSACGAVVEETSQVVVPEDLAPQDSFPFPISFVAEDLYGEQVTEAELGEKQAFFVYFWTTWCPTCVVGMPVIAGLAEEFADSVGFVSLLGDFDAGRDAAIEIKGDSGSTFLTVDAMDEIFYPLMRSMHTGFVPTSALIDRNGNIIGNPIIGSDEGRFRSAIEDALRR